MDHVAEEAHVAIVVGAIGGLVKEGMVKHLHRIPWEDAILNDGRVTGLPQLQY